MKEKWKKITENERKWKKMKEKWKKMKDNERKWQKMKENEFPGGGVSAPERGVLRGGGLKGGPLGGPLGGPFRRPKSSAGFKYI